MRNLILFGLLIILLLGAQFASAKTVDEVIEKYIRALGGMDKLASLKSIYMEGVKEIMGQEVAVKIIKEQDKLCRTEIESGDVNSFGLITDKEAWTFFPLSSPVAANILDEDFGGLQTEMDIAGPLADYIAKGHKAELLGKEIVDGNTCYKIKLTTNKGKQIMFWVDTKTYLVSKSSGLHIDESGTFHEETFTLYKNYKDVDGIQLAHSYQTTTTASNAVKIEEEIFFHTILVNPTIDPKMYQPDNQS